jgi:molecular chaperone DnaK (HSP70)
LPRIEVKFLIDANGILQVGARDVRTGEQQQVEVRPSYGLNDGEIERMLEESIEYAEQDFTERQVIEARTEAESILVATSKALAGEQACTLPAEDRAKIDGAVAVLKESVAGNDYKLIRKRIDELNHATMNLAENVMNSAISTALKGKSVGEV